MANINRQALLKEYHLLTGILEEHEASKKEEKMKLSSFQQNYRNLRSQKFENYQSILPHKLIKNASQSQMSFDKKYLFKKSNLNIADLKSVNQNFKAKFKSPKNQTSKCISSTDNGVLSKDILSVSKRTVLCPESKSEKISTVSSDKPSRMCSQFLAEIESLTELLKQKNSENKSLNSYKKNENNIPNKLSIYSSNNKKFSGCNNYNSVKHENIFSKTNSLSNFPSKVKAGNISTSLNGRNQSKNCYTKLNPSDKNKHITNSMPSKYFSCNKYSYRKADLRLTNSEINKVPSNFMESKDRTKSKDRKVILGSHVRKVIYTDPKKVIKIPCLPSNVSGFAFKPSSPIKHNLTVQFSATENTLSSKDKLCKEYPIATKINTSLLKVKTPNVLNSSKVSKLKTSSINSIKVNKHLSMPNKNIHKTSFATKKMKRKVNSKYKVINKTLTPSSKALSPLNNLDSKENSVAIDESNSFIQKFDDSMIDKLEKDLLAISAALTSTPSSSKTTVDNYNYKISQNSQTKVNLTLHSKRMPLKKSKTRISKYKIVNSNVPQNQFMKKEQNFVNLKKGFKNTNSKFCLVNKYSRPAHVLAPLKQGKSILVKRLFKNKNTIINKNTSPISYSAKMIKSKYLTLNKKKFHSWQKHSVYTKVPSHHQKFKEYYLRPNYLHNKYQKTAALVYHPKMVKNFRSYGYSTVNQFSKNASRNKYKRKLKSGSPVVFIHGMRYSRSSSGKTLKKLPAKGQTNILRRTAIGGKLLIRTPKDVVKIPTPISSNLASRVLHRSINRILSASTKKSLTKVNTYCMFYNRFGRCNRGVKCTYIHDPSKIAVCTRFLRGTCKTDGCPFSHEITPGKMAICSFYLVGACEKENCPYRHEKLLPDAQLCKAFVQGYCPNGKECKKAHILICPKYIQGDCDKGDSCAFPHPPKKIKKVVQKEKEEDEEKKQDALMETVSRYFLQTEDCLLHKNESDEISEANQFVPKQRRRLEEQPSFIPLFGSPMVSHD